jgi:hypothetical protein
MVSGIFQTFSVKASVIALLDDLKSEEPLTEIMIGEPLTQLIMKCEEWSHRYEHPKEIIMRYMKIMKVNPIPKCKKLIKLVNCLVIALIDNSNRQELCYCHRRPSIFQSGSGQLFYACKRWYNKENSCMYNKNRYMLY